jgi:hypothetical protein
VAELAAAVATVITCHGGIGTKIRRAGNWRRTASSDMMKIMVSHCISRRKTGARSNSSWTGSCIISERMLKRLI